MIAGNAGFVGYPTGLRTNESGRGLRGREVETVRPRRETQGVVGSGGGEDE